MPFSRSISRQTAMPALGKAMDAAALRLKAISNNIANVATPGYRRVEVRFEEDLRRALSVRELAGVRTDPRHISLGRPTIDQIRPEAWRPPDDTLPGEVNNIDIDMEMAKLAENQIMFQAAVRLRQERSAVMRMAITGTATG